MKKILSILLLSGLSIYASERTTDNYLIGHVGYYDVFTIIPFSLATNTFNRNGFTVVATDSDIKKLLITSVATVTSIILARYIWKKLIVKKRKRRYCLRCLSDLEIWQLVDHRKIVDCEDCIACGVPE